MIYLNEEYYFFVSLILSSQPLKGKNTVDLIVVGCILEVRDDSEPSVYWAAQVQCNVGGRLCLGYVGLNDPAHYRWMFYLDNRLRPLGWAKENHLSMKPPTGESIDLYLIGINDFVTKLKYSQF